MTEDLADKELPAASPDEPLPLVLAQSEAGAGTEPPASSDVPSLADGSDPEPLVDPSSAEVSSGNLVAARAVVSGGGSGGLLAGVATLGGVAAAGGGGTGAGAVASAAPAPSTTVEFIPGSTNTLANRLTTDAGVLPSIASGGLTRDSTVGLSGTLVSGTSVSIYDGQQRLGVAMVSGTIWSFVTPVLADGQHNLTARFSSAQGQTSTQSVSVTVDTQASGSLSANLQTDSGAQAFISEGGSTTDSTLGLSGTAEPGSLVQIYDGDNLLGWVRVSVATTAWSYTTPQLGPGSHALSVTVTDPAGNEKSIKPVTVNVARDGLDPAFSIEFVYTGSASTYASYFQQAASFWSSVITGDLPDAQGVDDLRIRVAVSDIAGDGGSGTTAGQARVTAVRPNSLLPYEAELQIDSVLLPRLISEGQLDKLLRHEMAHALGFGLNFEALGLVDPLNPLHYTGTYALAQYRKLGRPTATFVPLEDQGGVGTVGGHWKESVFDHELMTGYLETGLVAQPVSAMTLAALQDLGYSVNYSKAEAYALPNQFSSGVMP